MENIINRVKSMSLLLNVKYAKIHSKYDSHDFLGIVNLELGWKISKIIFRLNYGTFLNYKNPGFTLMPSELKN